MESPGLELSISSFDDKMKIPQMDGTECDASDDNEVSTNKSHHYRLGPDNLDDTLEYMPLCCDPVQELGCDNSLIPASG
ncbi:hypothetical protein XENTR_v10021299 [Xenopus tropicalis]|nr:hypothetical protein XENTR_v10021299 [Xenopus tropicalis]KAE8585388.1 hypothetical protein XENTR_v10021299 [Xenopus tropicalis]KAE8585389.1 hypothetical protein XENTR_v10021299 [Xenopus tropicalis]KAE8585390.1 hypothetical protein XENTR_v10021299 [Xenopus tropicalis]KAE8585391.1 hypothetical protein XENTR_v10021299 [Xenopus tropicalis]